MRRSGTANGDRPAGLRYYVPRILLHFPLCVLVRHGKRKLAGFGTNRFACKIRQGTAPEYIVALAEKGSHVGLLADEDLEHRARNHIAQEECRETHHSGEHRNPRANG